MNARNLLLCLILTCSDKLLGCVPNVVQLERLIAVVPQKECVCVWCWLCLLSLSFDTEAHKRLGDHGWPANGSGHRGVPAGPEHAWHLRGLPDEEEEMATQGLAQGEKDLSCAFSLRNRTGTPDTYLYHWVYLSQFQCALPWKKK